MQEEEIVEERESKVEKMSTKKGRDFICPSTSNPYHVCADFCFEKMSEKLQDVRKEPEVLEYPVQNMEMTEVERKGATPTSLKAVKSFNSCAGNFFSTNPRERTKKIWVITERSDVHPDCRNAANPYHKCAEYCFKKVPEKDQLGLADTKSKEENKLALYRERLVNPECQFTSNPYHTCAEYCFQKAPERERRGDVMTLRSIKKILSIRETTNVHPQCKFASNPYHECHADCFQNELDQNKARGVIMKPNKETNVVVPGEKGDNPESQFASNPYHVCVEYCLENFPKGKMHGHVMKLNNQQELKKAVSHRETTNVHPRCKFESNSNHECDAYCFKNELYQNISEGVTESKAGKKETSYELRREVNTKCKLVSNTFHKSSECCSEGYPDKNQPLKSIQVTTKEKNRNSLSEKRDHPIMEKSTANLEFVEASKPIYNNVESSVAIIFPDQILKNSEDSNLVEESNPDSDYTDFSEGITMEVVAKDLMREVEMRITKEPSDAQPLLFDASGLFLEWAKYCSSENEAEDKIFMQVERRAFDTKNGQGNDNLKCNDSSNLAKVKSNSLQSSLPTSVLFFLGFLFSLFKWTEVIHSVVMSSERKSSRRLMDKRPVKSK